MAVASKPGEPRLVGLPGRQVDLSKPGLHCVDHRSFLAQLTLAIEESAGSDQREGSRYGKLFYTKGYYFRRHRSGYALTRDLNSSSDLLDLSAELSGQMVENLGLPVSLDALLGTRMVILWSKFSPHSLGTPTLLTICTNELNDRVTFPVPELCKPLPPYVFGEAHPAIDGGPDWF